jgi:hypothetical protein
VEALALVTLSCDYKTSSSFSYFLKLAILRWDAIH